MCIFGFWEENEKWINFKNKTENLKALSKYKTEKTEHSVLTDEICLSERHEENKNMGRNNTDSYYNHCTIGTVIFFYGNI